MAGQTKEKNIFFKPQVLCIKIEINLQRTIMMNNEEIQMLSHRCVFWLSLLRRNIQHHSFNMKVSQMFSVLCISWGRRDSINPNILTIPMESLGWWGLRSQALEESFYLDRGWNPDTLSTLKDKAMMCPCGLLLTNRWCFYVYTLSPGMDWANTLFSITHLGCILSTLP